MRSPQNTATAPESLHVPVSAAAATTEPTPTASAPRAGRGRDGDRVGSVGGDRQHGGGLAGSPTYGAPIKEVLAFHARSPGARSRSLSAWRR